ncbi:MAG: CPBP family intramembrane metalloprotease [bacterium]|nr:CPBP family intramembrane metalloprotease [bacterium]
MNDDQQVVRRPFYRHDPLTTIIATIGIFLISQVVAGLLIWLYPSMMEWTEAEATNWIEKSVAGQFAYVLIAEAIAIGLVLQLLKRANILKARIGWLKIKAQDIGWALLAYGIYFIVYLAVVILAKQLIPSLDVEQEQQVGFDNAYTNIQLLMTFVSLVILPPIAEEIIFRGYLFTSLRAKFSFKKATIVTSILFGIAHLQFGAGAPLLWIAALDTFILSCFLCYLRDKTGSLWPPIILHALKNGVAFTILFGSRLL